MKTQKRAFLFLSILLLIIIIFSILFTFFITKKGKIIYLEYGDDFSQIDLYDGNKVYKLDKEISHLIFYMSDTCNPCIQELNLISQLDKLEVFYKLNINLIWTDNIPYTILNKYNLNNVKNYSLKGKIQLTGSTPYFYILQDNKVVFEAGNDNMNRIIKKIIELSNSENIQLDVWKEICNEKEYNIDEKFFIFLTENCEGCKKWEDYLEQNNLEQKVLLILDYQTDKYENYIYDRYGFYKQIYGIEKFPSGLKYLNNVIQNIELEELY